MSTSCSDTDSSHSSDTLVKPVSGSHKIQFWVISDFEDYQGLPWGRLTEFNVYIFRFVLTLLCISIASTSWDLQVRLWSSYIIWWLFLWYRKFRSFSKWKILQRQPSVGWKGLSVAFRSLNWYFLCRFDIIMKCWEEKPEDRPTFSDLVASFSQIMELKAGYIPVTQS